MQPLNGEESGDLSLLDNAPNILGRSCMNQTPSTFFQKTLVTPIHPQQSAPPISGAFCLSRIDPQNKDLRSHSPTSQLREVQISPTLRFAKIEPVFHLSVHGVCVEINQRNATVKASYLLKRTQAIRCLERLFCGDKKACKEDQKETDEPFVTMPKLREFRRSLSGERVGRKSWRMAFCLVLAAHV
jgi:hypothetical protein